MANALTNIQKDNKHIMQALHESCGFDFCKPYAVKEMYGRYTENKIKRTMADTLLEGEAVTPNTHRIIILTRDERNYINGRRWNLVEILSRNINIGIGSTYALSTSFDCFYAKNSFAEFRKSDTCQTVIVAQRKSDLCYPKVVERDMERRMELVDVRYGYTWRSNERHISSLTVKDVRGKNDTFYVYGKKTENLDEIIDKSGYLLYIRHDDLMARARQRRYDREKAIADSADFSEHVATLANLIAYKKGILVERFKDCKTYADYEEFSKEFSYFGGFASAVRDFEGYNDRVNEKRFASVEAEEHSYNAIMTKLT